MRHLHAAVILALLAAVLVPAPAGARAEVDSTAPPATQAHERRALDVAHRDHDVRYWESRAVTDRIRKGQATCQNPAAEAQRICASTRELEKETHQ